MEEPVLQHVIEKYIAQEYRVWQKQNNHSNLLNGAFLKIFNSIKLIHTGNTRIFEWHPRTLLHKRSIAYNDSEPKHLFHEDSTCRPIQPARRYGFHVLGSLR